jgi:anaerobic dimethyl sulfoxide reductase subunit B (iron-sulfur subunit)
MSLGFFYNMDVCIGCKLCRIACKDKNGLEVGNDFRKVKTYSVGEYPDARVFHISMSCNHCESPACVLNCPTGAMFQQGDGAVLHDDDVCIGCQICISSCPYSAPTFIEEKSIVRKCDSCISIRENGGKTTCVSACPMRALSFGDIDEFLTLHDDASRFSGDTNPNLVLKQKPYMDMENSRELVY